MNRKKYLGLIWLLTAACIVGGSIWHGSAHSGKNEAWKNTARQENSGQGTAGQETAAREDASPDGRDGYLRPEIAGLGEDTLPFQNLKLDLSVYDVQIQQGEYFDISYRAWKEDKLPAFEQKGDTLYIRQKTDLNGIKDIKDLKNLVHMKDPVAMVITLPADAGLEEIRADLGVGDLRLSNFTVKKLVLDNGTGDIKLQGLTADRIQIDASVGDVTVEGTGFRDLAIDSATGDVEVLDVADLEGYQISLDTGVGDIRVNDGEISGGSYEREGTKKGRIRIDCAVGDIELQ